MENFKARLEKEIEGETEEKLRKRLLELATIYDVIRDVNTALGLGDCLEMILKKAIQVVGVERSSLMLMEKGKGELVIKIARGVEAEVVKRTRVRIGENIAGWVAKEGKPLLIEDISKDKRCISRDGKKYYTPSLLSVPLKVREKVIGVINVNNKITKKPFTEEDLKLLTALADEAAVAIERSSLYEEVKKRAAGLSVLTDKLKRVSEAKSDFVSNISHEFRTPLTSIKEAISLILEGATGKVTGKQGKFLEIAHRNVERLTHLADNLLDLSKLEAGKREMKRELISVRDIAEDVVAGLRTQAEGKGLEVRNLLPKELPKIYADAECISQVFTNLLSNAIKFTPQGGRIALDGADKGEDLELTVSDAGVGIPVEKFETIFDRYQQLDVGSLKGVKGTGLGLAITKDIIKAHKGEIWVESELGKGSTFSFTLPKDLRAKERKAK